ncbi:hypothetical protein K1719_011535 [Acacia pycnantha]|nr:hypothetical protein K1719_011535 [Acacia pycnantha]
MGKQMSLIGLLMVVVVCLSFAASSEARRYIVGGNFGWGIPPNQTFYSDWASDKTFLVGDQLVFKWTGIQIVADVRKEDYNNCTTPNTIVSTAARSPNKAVFIFTLVIPGPHYYISTIDDNCEKGQKFSIDVKWPFSTSGPSPTPTTP